MFLLRFLRWRISLRGFVYLMFCLQTRIVRQRRLWSPWMWQLWRIRLCALSCLKCTQQRSYCFQNVTVFYLKQKSWSYVEFATFIKKKAAFCGLSYFYVPALALLSTVGINDVSLRDKFLEIENCTLKQALSIAQKKENYATKSVRIKNENAPQVTSIPTTAAMLSQSPFQNLNCLSCGGRHKRQTCKFRDAKCLKCHKTGHLARVCKSAIQTTPKTGNSWQRAANAQNPSLV